MKRPSKATSTTYRLVGGKGGVGKTTLAAAWGVAAAAQGARTLVISTDPAPSLGDALGVKLGAVARPIPGVRGVLHGLEIDPHRALARWLKPRTPALEAIALRGTWLDEADIRLLLGLSLPGIDEVASLLEVLRHGQSARYDEIVVDTAPTGHTLRMLWMPETLAGLARVFEHMQAKHHVIVEALRGVRIEDAADAVIQRLQEDATTLRALLRDPRLTRVALITLPEVMSVEETLDAAKHLSRAGIPLAQIVVNRMTPPAPDPCAWCGSRRRVERQAISMLRSHVSRLLPASPASSAARRNGGLAATVSVTAVDATEKEPIGVRALLRISRELNRQVPRARGSSAAAVPRRRLTAVLQTSGERVTLSPPGRLLMFGGKGGVGKTTCAAAAALQIARRYPERRVLLLSTDPAHSLGDALNAALSDTATRLAGAPENLGARELDAARAFQTFRAEYQTAIDEVFTRLSRGAVDVQHDRRVLQDLLQLAPPGLDEVVAVLGAIDLLLPVTYDTLVVDTAPTGHALRLLETPATVQDWVKALMSIVLKYRSVMALGELGAALLRLSQRLGAFRKLLADPGEAQFVIVTRLAALPRAETLRLQKSLGRLRVRVPAVIVNAVGAGTCRRCDRVVRAEQLQLSAFVRSLRAQSRSLPVILAPATVPPPQGVPALTSWVATWRELPARSNR